MVHDLDPLQSEPKPKRFKKSKYKYPCSLCDFVASQAGNLKIHIERKYKGVRCPCSECELSANTTRNLRRHVENKHNGMSYSCSQCKHAATTASDLKRQKKSFLKTFKG